MFRNFNFFKNPILALTSNKFMKILLPREHFEELETLCSLSQKIDSYILHRNGFPFQRATYFCYQILKVSTYIS